MAGATNSDDTGSHGMTPPRRLQPEDGGEYGQPAEGGGSLAINHSNEVARAMREEMAALWSAVEASVNALKRENDVKSGAIKMIGDKINKLEMETKDIKEKTEKWEDENYNFIQINTPRISNLEEEMENIKNIAEIIKDNDKVTDIMNKHNEVNKKNEDMIINIEAKLKEDFNLDVENLDTRINDIINRIGGIQKSIDERDGMPSITPLPIAGEATNPNQPIIDMMKEMATMNQNFQEMVMKGMKKEEGEGKGKTNNTKEESNDGIASGAKLPTDIHPPGLGGHTAPEPLNPRVTGGRVVCPTSPGPHGTP